MPMNLNLIIYLIYLGFYLCHLLLYLSVFVTGHIHMQIKGSYGQQNILMYSLAPDSVYFGGRDLEAQFKRLYYSSINSCNTVIGICLLFAFSESFE